MPGWVGGEGKVIKRGEGGLRGVDLYLFIDSVRRCLECLSITISNLVVLVQYLYYIRVLYQGLLFTLTW